MKKPWQKPELVVLVRNRPDEAVLAACKTGSAPGGYLNYNGGCWYESDLACYKCSLVSSS